MTPARIALRSGLASGLATLALLAGPAVAGCSSLQRPDPLRVALGLNQITADEISAALKANTAKAVADFNRRIATCPPVEGRDACIATHTRDVLDEYGPEDVRLRGLQMWQHEAAGRLATASQCRASELPCEGAELVQAASPLAAARAGLAVRDAGADGAP
jgi:hypothetical protein